MVAQESYQDLVDEIPSPNVQDLDEAEETLSLCDLPIYSTSTDAADWEDFTKEDQSSSSSSEQDYFEFFSEEWSSTSSTCPAADNIVFCGKLIPYKLPAVSSDTHMLESNKQQKPKKRGLFGWNSRSLSKSKTSKSNGTEDRCMNTNESFSISPVLQKYGYKGRRCDQKYDYSVGKVSILTSPAKSRWYLLMFGLARFPTEMELRDMRSRQRRQSTSTTTLFRSDGGGEKVTVGGSRGKGLWGLIGALGCGGHHHANAMVKASFGCFRPL